MPRAGARRAKRARARSAPGARKAKRARASGSRGAAAEQPAADKTKWEREAVEFHVAIPEAVRADVLAMLNAKSRQALPYKAPLPEVAPGVYLVSWVDAEGKDRARSYRYARATLDYRVKPRNPRESFTLTLPDATTSRPLARGTPAESARASGSRDAQAEQAPSETKTDAYAARLAALPLGVLNGVNPVGLEVSAQRLGKGSYGRVYAASLGGSTAAAKLYNGTRAQQSQAVLQELVAYALAGHHQNLVEVIAAGLIDHGGTPRQVLVLERARFSLGAQMLERASALEPWETRSIARDLACGIAALHARNLAHTDVKPGNVLLFDKPRRRAKEKGSTAETCGYDAKLADLGGAVGSSPGSRGEGATTTQPYRAPELVGRSATSLWSDKIDAWSYGMVLYEMGTGKPQAVERLGGVTGAETPILPRRARCRDEGPHDEGLGQKEPHAARRGGAGHAERAARAAVAELRSATPTPASQLVSFVERRTYRQ